MHKWHAACLIDRSGNILSWNLDCAELFSCSSSEILYQPLSNLFSSTSRGHCAAWLATMPEQSAAQEFELLRPDGSTVKVTLMLVPQFDPAGQVSGLIAVFSFPSKYATEADFIKQTPLSAISSLFPGALCVIDQAHRFVLWNENLESLTGLTKDELQLVEAGVLFEGAARQLVEHNIAQVFKSSEEINLETELRSKNGTTKPLLLSGTRIECEGKYYFFGIGYDISKRHEQERQLRLRERALHAANNAIVITRCEGNSNPIEYVNPAFERISGYSREECMGRDSRFMAAPGLDDDQRAQLREAILQKQGINVVFRNLRKNGELFWNDLTITPVTDEHDHVNHFIGVINDVTATKQHTAYLEHEINHDPLTGLANRNLLWDRLEQALNFAQRSKTLVAVVLIDLDKFKFINDTYGHEAGDEVLMVVAKRMVSSVRDIDTVARLSGDEFVLVLVNQPSLRFTLRMIERLRKNISESIMFDSTEIPLSASIGISVFPHDGNRAIDLIKAADVAMYHGKSCTSDSVQFFSQDMKTTTDAKLQLEKDMRNALRNDEIFLQFQPCISVQTGLILGVEALVRWQHPARGILFPSSFLPDAEENGMIIPIGNWIIEHTCRFIQKIKNNSAKQVVVSINSSYREFSQHNYIKNILETIQSFDLAPGNFELEFSEENFLRNPQLSRDIAKQMAISGMKLAIDHFGDGISNLNALTDLSIRRLKMTRKCVESISPENTANVMAKTLIDIAHNLNILVVADGVETENQALYLRSSGCDQLQGHYFSPPLEEDAMFNILASTNAG